MLDIIIEFKGLSTTVYLLSQRIREKKSRNNVLCSKHRKDGTFTAPADIQGFCGPCPSTEAAFGRYGTIDPNLIRGVQLIRTNAALEGRWVGNTWEPEGILHNVHGRDEDKAPRPTHIRCTEQRAAYDVVRTPWRWTSLQQNSGRPRGKEGRVLTHPV